MTRLNEVKKELKDLASLKQHAASVSKAIKDIERVSQEVKNLETDLEATGSSRTAEDVQNQLNDVSANLYVIPFCFPCHHIRCAYYARHSRSNERERQTLQTEKERAHNALRTHEKDLNDMQLREVNLKSHIKDRTILEKQVEEMKAEIVATSQNFKVRVILIALSSLGYFFTESRLSKDIDLKIEAAQIPIKKLDEEYEQTHTELTRKISEAQRMSQELNMSVDRLDGVNKLIDR